MAERTGRAKFSVTSFNGVITLNMNIEAARLLAEQIEEQSFGDSLNPVVFAIGAKVNKNIGFAEASGAAEEAESRYGRDKGRDDEHLSEFDFGEDHSHSGRRRAVS